MVSGNKSGALLLTILELTTSRGNGRFTIRLAIGTVPRWQWQDWRRTPEASHVRFAYDVTVIVARTAPAQSWAVEKHCVATGSDFAHAALAQSCPRSGSGLLTQMRQAALEELHYVVTFERVSLHDRHQQWRANATSQFITNALYNFPLNHR
jgi:hypothetical protein